MGPIGGILNRLTRMFSGSQANNTARIDASSKTAEYQSFDATSWAVSMGGSNEFVECFCGGAVAEGGSGAVARFVGDGVEVGVVAGDALNQGRCTRWPRLGR